MDRQQRKATCSGKRTICSKGIRWKNRLSSRNTCVSGPKLLRNIPIIPHIEISYDPIVPNTVISDFDIGTLMNQPHASTKGMSPCVWDPGTELVAPTWLEYIRTQSGQWVDIIERHMDRKVTDQLKTHLSLVESQGIPKICLIHRDKKEEQHSRGRCCLRSRFAVVN